MHILPGTLYSDETCVTAWPVESSYSNHIVNRGDSSREAHRRSLGVRA